MRISTFLRGGDLALALDRARAVGVELHVLGVDDHVGVGQLAQLAQLGVGERGLGGPAAADDHDLLDRALGHHLDRVVGGVGDLELLARQHEHARDVHGHVAVADHHGALAGEVELEVAEVRVAVVPGDELGGGPAAGQVLARDAHAGGRSGRPPRRSPRGSAP